MRWREICGKLWSLWNSQFSPGGFLWMYFQLQMRDTSLVSNPSLEIQPLKQLFALARSHFQEVLNVLKGTQGSSFSVSEMNVVANPSCVSGCQTGGKTIKGFTRRSSRSDSQWSSPRVGLRRIDSLGNASEGGMRGRQLDDLQYMRLRTRGTKKPKGDGQLIW